MGCIVGWHVPLWDFEFFTFPLIWKSHSWNLIFSVFYISLKTPLWDFTFSRYNFIMICIFLHSFFEFHLFWKFPFQDLIFCFLSILDIPVSDFDLFCVFPPHLESMFETGWLWIICYSKLLLGITKNTPSKTNVLKNV